MVEERAPGGFTLVVRTLGEDGPAERPFALDGRQVIGPVLGSGAVGFCTEAEAGVVDLQTRQTYRAPFPRDFSPLTARRREGVRIPAGTIPLALETSANGLALLVVGDQDGLPGTLTMSFPDRRTAWERLDADSTVTSNRDGSLTVRGADQIHVFGGGHRLRMRSPLAPGLPAAFDGGRIISIAHSGGGEHRLRVTSRQGAAPNEFIWQQPELTPDTCDAPIATANGIAVPVFAASAAGVPSMDVAFWQVEGGSNAAQSS